MPKLTIVTREGKESEVDGKAGLSVMEVIRDAGFDELTAMCGGSCACATCHVYVDPAWLGILEAPHESECDLLESSSHREANSRLACQIPFGDQLAGLRVKIAPEG
jgi:2Fe-2S ferredoxin